MAETRILLLEDEASTSNLLIHVLRGAGYMVDLAQTIAQAARRLRERPYGLVIADWRVPDGDGIAIADQAAERGAKTAVLTGYAFQMPREAAERHDIWMKPMRPTELIGAVERYIGKPSED